MFCRASAALTIGLLPDSRCRIEFTFIRSTSRKHEFYIFALQDAGFRDITVQTIRLELPFLLISAIR
jgi:hypothetical protein